MTTVEFTVELGVLIDKLDPFVELSPEVENFVRVAMFEIALSLHYVPRPGDADIVILPHGEEIFQIIRDGVTAKYRLNEDNVVIFMLYYNDITAMIQTLFGFGRSDLAVDCLVFLA